MSREVDGLVLMGQAYKISYEAPSFEARDIAESLWYFRNNEPGWYRGWPDAEEAVKNLHAGEVFLGLGKLVTDRFVGLDTDINKPINPYRNAATSIIEEISPFTTRVKLPPEMAVRPPERGEVSTDELGAIFGEVVKSNPAQAEEFGRKWSEADVIVELRGEVAVPESYDVAEVGGQIREMNESEPNKLVRGEIAPDVVEFDEEGNVAMESYYETRGLIDRAGAKARPTKAPHYSMFREENAADMLSDALMDLRQISQAIRKIGRNR